MIRPYVCRQCRWQSLQRIARRRNLQWQQSATFISLRTANPQAQPEPHTPSPIDDTVPEKPDSHLQTPVQRSRLGRYSRHVQDGGFPIRQPEPVDPERLQKPHSSTISSATPSPAQAVDDCLRRRDGMGAWQHFERNYTSRDCPALTNPSFSDVPLLNGARIFERLSDAVVTGFCNGSILTVTPTTVLFRFEQLGLARAPMWRRAFAFMTDHLLWSLTSKKQKRDPEALLTELVSLWRLFFQCKGTVDDPLQTISTEWVSMPDVRSSDVMHRDTGFGSRLQRHHPKYPTTPPLHFSAITIFNIFHLAHEENWRVSDSLRQQTAPFLDLLAYLLVNSNVSSAFHHFEMSSSFKALPEEFRKKLLNQVDSAPGLASKIRGAQFSKDEEVQGRDPAKRELSEAEKASNLEKFFTTRIAREVQSQAHSGQLEKLWREAMTVYKGTDRTTTIPPRIYDSFLAGFMSLYQSDRAVEIWNHMSTHGIQPTLRTWNAMMNGCVKARDLHGLNAMWERMLSSGVEPDNFSWTTRVHGLMVLRQINPALHALDEMGKKWLAAETALKASKPSAKEHPTNNIAKPSIEVINGAVSGIVQIPSKPLPFPRKLEFIQKVLQWASNFNLKPDIITYNTLIGLYMSVNDNQSTTKLLRQMEEEGISGDVATHTMLMRAVFNNQRFSHLSESEQADYVLNHFSELEDGGLKLNGYIYSTAIDRLIKQYHNFEAVRVIIDHMLARNLKPGPQIYGSLVTHYFQQDPPNIPAVDSLVALIFGPPRQPTDKFFFERLLEGYAAYGQIGQMMSVLTRMSKHGKLPGWRALTCVVQALAEAKEWERARLLVRDVQMGEGVAHGGVTGGVAAQRDFFDMVSGLEVNVLDSRAGDHLRASAAAGLELVQAERNIDVEEMVEPKARELYAQPETEHVDQFANAEQASSPVEQLQTDTQQWKSEDNGHVGGIPL